MSTRILMFGWEFPPYNSGGLGVACLGLTKALTDLGVEVAFVMPRRVNIHVPWARFLFAEGENITVHSFESILSPYITEKSYSAQIGEYSNYARDLFSEVARYSAYGSVIAEREYFDIIYAHDWLSFGAAIEAKRATGKPLVVHVHATEFDRCGGESVNQHVYDIERKGMEVADIVIAVSDYTKRIIVQKYGIQPDKIRVVHNGIDETTAPQGSEMRQLRALKKSGKKIVLFLGRLTLQKGPDYFLKAAREVLAHDNNVVFVVSGSGDMEGQMMRLAAELGIADKVYFTGFLQGNERDEMYSAADLFVMPSISEPFGIAPLEAMKLGTPVLLSKQAGICEVVKHALKIDFWDIDRMAGYILSVVRHPALRATLSENGKMEADRITWSQAANKIQGIMHELVH